MDVLEAIYERHSVRGYLPRTVSKEILTSVIDAARFAPSGVNTQPWKVTAVLAERLTLIGDAICQERAAHPNAETPDYQYYPSTWVSPYRERRKATGLALYSALKIDKNDNAKRMEAWLRNYYFFQAPAGFFFFIDAALEKGSWLDMGMFLQNVMLSARGHGLDTCPMASVADYPAIVKKYVTHPPAHHLVCGMAIGYKDPEHPANSCRTQRLDVDEICTFMDF